MKVSAFCLGTVLVALFASPRPALAQGERPPAGREPGTRDKEKADPSKPTEGTGREVRVTGEIRAVCCAADAESHHCTADCVKKGRWTAVVDEASGALYVIHEKESKAAAERFSEWAGQRATIQGRLTDAKGVGLLSVATIAKAERTGAAGRPTAGPTPVDGTITGSVVNVFCVAKSGGAADAHACSEQCFEDERALFGIRDDASGKIYVAVASKGKQSEKDEKGGSKDVADRTDPRKTHDLLDKYFEKKVKATGKIAGPVIEIEKAEKT